MKIGEDLFGDIGIFGGGSALGTPLSWVELCPEEDVWTNFPGNPIPVEECEDAV